MDISGAKVAVVGGAGFLGSHMVNHLVEDKGCTVIVLDNLMVGQRRFVHPKATFVWCDISISENVIRQILEANKVKYVFNYAAVPYVPTSYSRPLCTFDINARGALMLMNAAQDAGVRGMLQISSAEIYGDIGGKISEFAPAVPHSSYGASKLAIDTLVQARWRENKTRCIALRQFNCIGARETHPYVVPEIISQLSKSSTIYLGNDSARDFMCAVDAVRMATALLESEAWGEVFNLGSEEVIGIYDVAQLIGSLMGNGKVTIIPDPLRVRAWEIWHLQSDNTKIYEFVKERPRHMLV